MPSRNQKKRSKQRAEYLQKQDENKAKARALYKADPEKKDLEENRAAKRRLYEEDLEENRAAKKRRYEEDLEENRAAKRRRYEEDLEENHAAKRRRYEEDLEGNRAANRQKYEDNSAAIKKHLKGVGIGMTPLSDWLNVLPRGRGTAGVTACTTTTTQWYVMACYINIKKLCMHATFVEHSRAVFGRACHPTT